jgi:hypothetical protein
MGGYALLFVIDNGASVCCRQWSHVQQSLFPLLAVGAPLADTILCEKRRILKCRFFIHGGSFCHNNISG